MTINRVGDGAAAKCRNPACAHVFEVVLGDVCPHCNMPPGSSPTAWGSPAGVSGAKRAEQFYRRCVNRNCALVFDRQVAVTCGSCGQPTELLTARVDTASRADAASERAPVQSPAPQSAGTAAAGWHHMLGDVPGTERWWDGALWTGATRRASGSAGPGVFAGVAESSAMRRLDPEGRSRHAPVELWLTACGLLVVAALLSWPVLSAGPDALRLVFNSNDLARAIGALVLMVLATLGSLAVALVLLAVGILRASRPAQILTMVLSVVTSLATLVLTGGSGGAAVGDATATIIVLICVGIVAALVGREPVREFFATDLRPLGVSMAAATNAYLGWVFALDGALLVIAGAAGAKFVLVGIALLGAAIVMLRLNSGLHEGSAAARTTLLWVYGAIAVLLIVVNQGTGASAVTLIVPLAMLASGAVGLSVPESSKRHFAVF